MNNGKRLIFIDYLRVLCMLYIVGYWHLFDYTNAFPEYFNPVTEKITVMALGLFTFMSGFLSGKSAMKSSGVADFYMKRLVRVYPLYMASAILFFLWRMIDGFTLLKSLSLVSMLYGPPPPTLWFVAMIMLFYVTVPFLLRLAGNLPRYILAVVLAMVFLTVLMIGVRTVDARVILYFPCFCVGTYCAVNGVENRLASIKHAMITMTLGVILFAAKTGTGTIAGLKLVPFVLASSYLVFLTSYRSRGIFPNISLISFLSYGSYAMYLFHRPIYATLKASYFPKTGVLQILYLVGSCLFVVAPASWGLQWINDRLCTIAELKPR